MNEFKLSKRLACVAGIINPGGVLADIGTALEGVVANHDVLHAS